MFKNRQIPISCKTVCWWPDKQLICNQQISCLAQLNSDFVNSKKVVHSHPPGSRATKHHLTIQYLYSLHIFSLNKHNAGFWKQCQGIKIVVKGKPNLLHCCKMRNLIGNSGDNIIYSSN